MYRETEAGNQIPRFSCQESMDPTQSFEIRHRGDGFQDNSVAESAENRLVTAIGDCDGAGESDRPTSMVNRQGTVLRELRKRD